MRGWKSNSYVQDEGIIFKAASSVENGSTNLYKTFGSYNRGSYEPRLYVTYTVPPSSFSLNYSSTNINEGSTKTLTATGASGTVTWNSNNTAVATVSSSGVVTARKAGAAMITASVSNAAGTRSASCLVYVTIADGVYYIKNNASGYYLGVANEGIFNGSDVAQYPIATSGIEQLAQLWKIKYLSNGYYSVRPMHKLDMGLHDSSGNVDLWEIGTTDSIGGVMFNAWWTITYNTNGYVFRHAGSDIYAMTPSGGSTASGTSVVASTYSSTSSAFRWTLDRVTVYSKEVLLYNSKTGEVETNPIRGVRLGATSTLSNLNIAVSVYSGTEIDQTVTWSSDRPGVATVNSSTGAVTAISTGKAVITATAKISGAPTASYTVVVSELPVSGFEITYAPELWNYDPVQHGTNCYAYALNNQVEPGTNILCYMQPGKAGNGYILKEDLTKSNLIDFIESDAEKMGFQFIPVDKDEICANGTYKIAVVLDEKNDFHFYRQNPDGTWSHKPGQNPVTNLDAADQVITNPETADRFYSAGLNYDIFVGFYSVTPLNNMYSSTNSNALLHDQQIEYIAFDSNKYILPSVSNAETVHTGMSYSEVSEKIGAPQRQRTFGLLIVEYDIADGSKLLVQYVSQNGQLIACSCERVERSLE